MTHLTRLFMPGLAKGWLVIQLLFVSAAASAQYTFSNKETVTQSIEWFAVQSNIKVAKNINVYAEGQFRFVGSLEPMQFQARTGVDFVLNKKWAVMPLGYVYIWNPIYGKQPASYVNNEHRLYQQVVFRHQINRIFFNHRARLEERYIEQHDANGQSTGYSLFMNRFRYRLVANYPINHPTMEPGTYFAAFYDEIFVDFGTNVTYTDPDQNRLFLGGGYQINSKASIQAGFLYQLLIKLSGVKQEKNYGFRYSSSITSILPTSRTSDRVYR